MSTSATPPPPLSVYDAPPLETGGLEAREGFSFQDHIAAWFCLELLIDEHLLEVWCENLDDITLIWQSSETQAEYVQVKSNDLNQLWTPAVLCDREQRGRGHSILEKSLAYDRCRETCKFRIVTSRDVGRELKVLTYPFDSPARRGAAADFAALDAVMRPKVGDFQSANGRDFKFWLEHATWDVRHSEESVQNANVLKLFNILHQRDTYLAMDQVRELYARLVRKVWDASRVDGRIYPLKKRILKADLASWLQTVVMQVSAPSAGVATKVREKLTKASLASDMIDSALEQRMYYREEVLNPKYLHLDDRKLIDREVAALLHTLKSRLDNAKLEDNGVTFHDLCLSELQRLREELPINPKPPMALLVGCMYSITGRCLHRFRRVTA